MVDEAWLEVGPPPGVAPPIMAQELVVAAVPVQEAGEMALARQLPKLTLAQQLPKLTGLAPARLALERHEDMARALRGKRGDVIIYHVPAFSSSPTSAPRRQTPTFSNISSSKIRVFPWRFLLDFLRHLETL